MTSAPHPHGALQILPLLRCVSLRSCGVGNHGAMSLAEAVAGAAPARAFALRRLDVSCNGLDDQGLEALKWAAACALQDGRPELDLVMDGNNDFAEARSTDTPPADPPTYSPPADTPNGHPRRC